MNRNFIAFMLSCSAFFTVSESAMASGKIFGDWENGFVNIHEPYSTAGQMGKWEWGDIVYGGKIHEKFNFLQRNYDFIEDVSSFARKWSVFQNPETKAYIAADGIGYFMSVRKVAAE